MAAAAFACSADAADLPVKAPQPPATVSAYYDWSGFYIGGHIGYFWGRTRVAEDGVLTEPGAKTNGVVGGVLAGVNWQTGSWVAGLDGDFGWSNAHGTGTTPAQPTLVQIPNTYDLNWTSHVRGRVGYAAGNWLLFAAGGLSVADFDFHEGGTTCVANCQRGGTYFGWSAGGGVEYAFTRNVIARIEYLYDDFGHKDYIGSDGDPYRVALTGHTLRGALSWKF
jgi:outer membrane immunogenic protein